MCREGPKRVGALRCRNPCDCRKKIPHKQSQPLGLDALVIAVHASILLFSLGDADPVSLNSFCSQE